MLKRIQRDLALQRAYFSESGEEIAVRNLELGGIICAISLTLYILFYAVTALVFPQWMIAPVYMAFVPVILGLWAGSRAILRQFSFSVRQAGCYTVIMHAVLMTLVIIFSVFPHPDVPSVYFPLFMLMGPVLFILPVWEQATISTGSFIAFVLLVLRFKDPACWSHELFEATTAFLLSFGVIILMTTLRVQGEGLKDKYFDLSRHDDLTGLFNKGGGLAAARAYMGSKRPEAPFAVFFVDIDNFKGINDTLGHMEGDRLLRAVGRVLQFHSAPGDILCRFGGDEFMMLCPNLADAGEARAQGSGILEAVRRLSCKDGLTVSCSIGICWMAGGQGPIEGCIDQADGALYQAKAGGRDRLVLIRG